MTPYAFKERTAVFGGKDYVPLPAYIHGGPEGMVTCCWKLSWMERIKILFTGKVWQQSLTFGARFQPQKLSIDKPELTAS